jgi:hypothetical protein
MPMTKVISFKVPDDIDLQSRLGDTAKKAGIQAWELISQMLDLWDQKQSDEPKGQSWLEWRNTVDNELQAIHTKINVTPNPNSQKRPYQKKDKSPESTPPKQN